MQPGDLLVLLIAGILALTLVTFYSIFRGDDADAR